MLECTKVLISHDKVSTRFPNFSINLNINLQHAWSNSYPELHKISIAVFEVEFDPYMIKYGVYQEV